ncbi:MAG TPA: hypothetical protein VGO93_16375, partial [Candidatus Xenobia bacterium]
MPSFWITANSPGEISGWLKPVAKRLKQRRPDLTLQVILLPCTFATGHEAEVAKQVVDEVYTLANVPKTRPEGLLHLGGDLMYAAFLARQHGMPTWAYQWAQRQWDRFFTGYLVKTDQDRDRLLRQRIAPDKIYVVGDLVTDSVLDQIDAPPAPKQPPQTILYLPGSRQREAEQLLPFFLSVSKLLPGFRYETMLSPFLQPLAPRLVPHPKLEGMPAETTPEAIVGDGVSIAIRPHGMATVAHADLVVSIPGTKTAEAAVLGRPTVTILPLNAPEEIPSVGLVGLLDYLPGVGRMVKGFFLPRMVARMGYVAQPNILAGHEVVPEVRGVLTAAMVGERVSALLKEAETMSRMAIEL